MNKLQIALQDGFANDSVVITVDSRQAYAKAGVTTNLVISLADTVEVSVAGPTAHLTIEVTSKHVSKSLTVHVAETPFVAVSLGQDGRLEVTPSKEGFRYM